jgi:hypothetical protein
MMEGGGRHVEDLREIQDDSALRTLLGLKKMPALSTFGDWLARSGAQGGSTALGMVNEEVAGTVLSRLAAPDYTLDVDTAVIQSDKKEAVRLVVERWRDPQLQLFEPSGYCYHAIATNRDELSPEEVVWFHNRRGQVENLIKELKIGFGMEQMSSGDFAANSLWFSIGVLVGNLSHKPEPQGKPCEERPE